MQTRYTAERLATAWEPETYTISGKFWAIRCPVPSHQGGKAMDDRSLGNVRVWDVGPGQVAIKAWSCTCSAQAILSELESWVDWYTRATHDPKAALYEKYPGCQGCESSLPETELRVDHIKPKAKGGRSHPRNYALLCERCNSIKGAEMSLVELQGRVGGVPR